jgi:chaperonin GroEL (HSP60 family)
LDTSATETKGTVLIESAAQLEGYTRSEEDKMEALIKAIADSGAKVVVSGQAVGEVAMHFCERYKCAALARLSCCTSFRLRLVAGVLPVTGIEASQNSGEGVESCGYHW